MKHTRNLARFLLGSLILAGLGVFAAGPYPIRAEGNSRLPEGIFFDGTPGTGAPPNTLGSYVMTPFPDDGRPLNTNVTTVPDPFGNNLTFGYPCSHRRIGSGWFSWSHGYTGDVYYTNGIMTLVLTLPPDTKAFYFYVEPNSFGAYDVTATAQDGTTSGTVLVSGFRGAAYFGFFTCGEATVQTVTVTVAPGPSGFAIGEFGIDSGLRDSDGDGIGDACEEADLAIVKTADVGAPVAGIPFAYDLTVTHNGPGIAGGVSITDPLPSVVEFDSCAATHGTCVYDGVTHTITVDGFDLGELEQAVVEITVIPSHGGDIVNTATVVCDDPDPNPGDNTFTLALAVIPYTDTLYDDYARSWLCLNEYTGDWEWTAQDPRQGVLFLEGTGIARVQGGILTVRSVPGTPWSMSLKHYLITHRATGYLQYLAYRFRSSLTDRDTTNNPPICDVPPEP